MRCNPPFVPEQAAKCPVILAHSDLFNVLPVVSTSSELEVEWCRLLRTLLPILSTGLRGLRKTAAALHWELGRDKRDVAI